jgi:hypothetical protein
MPAREPMDDAVRYFSRPHGLSADVNRRLPRPAGIGRVWALGPLLVTLITLATAAAPAAAGARSTAAATATKLVSYHGYQLRVPASWPVYDLSRDSGTCVRFNRHAVYLGTPGAAQQCPADALGRTEAILISPSDSGSALPGFAAAQPLHGSAVRLRIVAQGVTVTATWGADPGILRRLLHDGTIGRQVAVGRATSIAPAAAHADAARKPVASAASTIYTGPGFDSCEDPSTSQLSAWLASGYRAVGTYIGGANMGCSQPNLNATYVSEEVAAGWHLIPTYVGLQAPTNSCGCASITPSEATTEGTEAAQDAASEATAVGIGAGNPIYDDMEAYPTGGTNTTTVLTFLSAWTTELHALGYVSGVYSSTDSGIHDLVAAASNSDDTYALPDDIWNADWNDEQSTSDSAIPSGEWTNHQRLHQNEGAHNETYDGVKMNIDGDYVDGSTVGSGNVVAPVSLPTLSVAPQADGAIKLAGSWSGGVGVTSWRLFGGNTATALTPLTPPQSSSSVLDHSSLSYFSEQALGSAGQVLASTPVTATPAHIAIYGHSLFAPAAGWAGLPVGCFTTSPCRITTSVSAGRTLVASSGAERVGAGQSGIVYVPLTSAGRKLLTSAHGRQLAVDVTATDGSVTKAKLAMNVIPFLTSGRGPTRSGTGTGAIKTVGYTDFVSGSGTGGILTDCTSDTACSVSTALTSGHTLLAKTGSEFIGANELGYVSFRLTAAGRTLLAKASGNQLAATVELSDGSAGSATAEIALVKFG